MTYFVSVMEWFIFDLFIGQDYLLLMLVYAIDLFDDNSFVLLDTH